MICANSACKRAGIELPLSEFNKNRHVCKDCDRKRARDHKKKKWVERKRIINSILGTRCIICGEGKGELLRCHEIYGKSHTQLLDTPLADVKANCESGRFARICARCHGKSHSLMDKGIVEWEVIRFYIKEFLQTEPPQENLAHLRAWQKYMREKIRERQLPLPLMETS